MVNCGVSGNTWQTCYLSICCPLVRIYCCSRENPEIQGEGGRVYVRGLAELLVSAAFKTRIDLIKGSPRVLSVSPTGLS